jgi:hypothetical protein
VQARNPASSYAGVYPAKADAQTLNKQFVPYTQIELPDTVIDVLLKIKMKYNPGQCCLYTH